MIKKAIGIVTVVLGLLTGVWAMNQQFVPREVHDMQIAGLTETIQNMRASSKLELYQKWYNFWDLEVEKYTIRVTRYPDNQEFVQGLQRAREKREEFRLKIEALQQ